MQRTQPRAVHAGWLAPCGLWLLLAAMLLLPGIAGGAVPETLYFADDFSGSGERAFFEGTLEGRTFTYEDGIYRIDTTGGATYGQSVLLDNLSTYRAEVTGRLRTTADNDGGGFGLSFGYRERDGGGNFLLLLAYDRGAFTVLRYVDGKTEQVHPPERTRLFESGDPVRITVEAEEGHYRCFLNGGQVAEFDEDELTRGGVGLFATAGSRVEFDDLRVFAELSEPDGFTDDFEQQRRLFAGEYSEVGYRYEDGRYIIDTTGTAYIGLSPYPGEVQDFELAVQAELLEGEPLGGYGIYVRDHPAAGGGFNQYRFLVSGGWFAVEKSEGDMPLALAQWVEHPAVRDGGVNDLRVRAAGEELVFFVNGVEVYRHTDSAPQPGEFGLYAADGIAVAFDNLEFTEL
jgi:hypothetical protein